MKISSFGLLALVMFTTCTPVVALADMDDDQSSYQMQQHTIPPASTQTQYQGSETEHSSILSVSSLVLYGTISAILWVVGYSAYKVYIVRRKITQRNLV